MNFLKEVLDFVVIIVNKLNYSSFVDIIITFLNYLKQIIYTPKNTINLYEIKLNIKILLQIRHYKLYKLYLMHHLLRILHHLFYIVSTKSCCRYTLRMKKSIHKK